MRQRPATTVAIVISNVSNDPPSVEARSVSVNDRLVNGSFDTLDPREATFGPGYFACHDPTRPGREHN
jgi:hypothetical protein